MLYIQHFGDESSRTSSLIKADFAPSIRAPLSTLPYLQVNATAAYRTTYYSESLADDLRTQIEVPVTRNYGDMRVDVVGPVLSRVFNPQQRDRRSHEARDRAVVLGAAAHRDPQPGSHSDRDRLRHHRRRRHADELRPHQPPDGAQGRARASRRPARRASCSTSRCGRAITPTRTPASSTPSYSYGYNNRAAESVLADLAGRARHADDAAGDRLPARVRPDGAAGQSEAARHEPERHAADRRRST